MKSIIYYHITINMFALNKLKIKNIKYARNYKYTIGGNNFKIDTDSFIDKNYLNENLKVLGDNLKNTTDNIMDASVDTTLCNLLKMVKLTEQKIKMEKLNHVEISASIMLGPISISINKKISSE